MPQVTAPRDSDTESVNAGVNTRLQTTLRNLNQNRRDEKQWPNPEEQIIKNRGRRELPRTPVRKSPRKRTLAGDFSKSNPSQGDSASDLPQASPFTKCLRSMLLSPPRPMDHQQRVGSTLRKRLLMSPDASTSNDSSLNAPGSRSNKSLKKIHYYSPVSRKLRSSDSSEIANLFDDSGVDLTSPSTSIELTPSTLTVLAAVPEGDAVSITSMTTTTSSTTSSRRTTSSANRARRRFLF